MCTIKGQIKPVVYMMDKYDVPHQNVQCSITAIVDLTGLSLSGSKSMLSCDVQKHSPDVGPISDSTFYSLWTPPSSQTQTYILLILHSKT